MGEVSYITLNQFPKTVAHKEFDNKFHFGAVRDADVRVCYLPHRIPLTSAPILGAVASLAQLFNTILPSSTSTSMLPLNSSRVYVLQSKASHRYIFVV